MPAFMHESPRPNKHDGRVRLVVHTYAEGEYERNSGRKRNRERAAGSAGMGG